MAQSIHLVLSGANLTDAVAINAMIPVYAVDAAITVMSSVAVSFGMLAFSLAISTRDDFNRVAALVIAVVSVVALVASIVVATMSEQEEIATMVGRACYFPWVFWSVALGINLLKRRDS